MKEGEEFKIKPLTISYDYDLLSEVEKDVPCNFPEFFKHYCPGYTWRLPLPVVDMLREYQKEHPLFEIVNLNTIRQFGLHITTVLVHE